MAKEKASMKTAIILLGGALLLIGCASGRSRATTVRAQPVASSTAPTPMATMQTADV